jgi:HSP20 family molecular chaperone IbpA
MKLVPHILKTLAESADLINTINGGMSLAHVTKYTLADHYLVTVKVPGVDKHSLKVELHNGQLFVFQRMILEEGIEIPYLVTAIELSENVDRQAVHANFQGKNLNIVLPFGEGTRDTEVHIEGL